MDIGSGNGFPAANLSNFHPHSFVIDGVECNSMEGFLQSLKFSSSANIGRNYWFRNRYQMI